jgi:hypothetical protein
VATDSLVSVVATDSVATDSVATVSVATGTGSRCAEADVPRPAGQGTASWFPSSLRMGGTRVKSAN